MDIEDQLKELEDALYKIDVNDLSDAKVYVNRLCKFVNQIEDRIARIAVEYQIWAKISGPYGAGRWVTLEENSCDYIDYKVGEWQASATSC